MANTNGNGNGNGNVSDYTRADLVKLADTIGNGPIWLAFTPDDLTAAFSDAGNVELGANLAGTLILASGARLRIIGGTNELNRPAPARFRQTITAGNITRELKTARPETKPARARRVAKSAPAGSVAHAVASLTPDASGPDASPDA